MPLPEINPSDDNLNRISPSKPLETDRMISQQNDKQSFASHMAKEAPTGSEGAHPQAGPTPMDLPRAEMLKAGTPSVESLLKQANTMQDSLGSVSEKLKTPNLQLKRSQAHLLRNKLTGMQDYTRSVSDKLGVESPSTQEPSRPGVLGRFLAYINDGQDQFAAVQQKLQEMASHPGQISPGDMMVIQTKLALAQQEIEYASTLLSKAVNSMTQIMSIQL